MRDSEKGQALMTLLIFTVIAIIITSAAIAILYTNTLAGTKSQEGSVAFSVAESGLENAVIRTMRDTAYVGETLQVGSGSAVITVTGTNPKTVTSVGTNGNFTRTVQVQLNYTSGSFSLTNWREM